MSQLAVGDAAPMFELPTDGDGSASLATFRGRKLALFFYPGDDTPSCTAEALDFTGAIKRFADAGTAVLGVSPDSVASHDRFKKKRGLGIALASDTDRTVIEAYGVWREKKMYGRAYMGVVRSTFLIDSQGRIAHIWDNIRVKGHVAEVLAAAEGL